MRHHGIGMWMKGLGVGLMAGMVAGAVGGCYMHGNRRGIKRNIGHALHTVGDLADSVLSMF